MKRNQSGFTMIELVVVIVILGILAVTAVPRFIDLQDQAEQAAVDGVAGNMGSAMAVNYAGCAAAGFDDTDDNCVEVDDCDDIGSVLAGGLPADYTVAASSIGTSRGDSAACTVTQTTSTPQKTATFQGINTL